MTVLCLRLKKGFSGEYDFTDGGGIAVRNALPDAAFIQGNLEAANNVHQYISLYERIIAFGRETASALGIRGKMSELHGSVHTFEDVPVLVVYDPAKIVNDRNLTPEQVRAYFGMIKSFAEGEYGQIDIPDYIYVHNDDTLRQAQSELERQLNVVLDVETRGVKPYHETTLIGLLGYGSYRAVLIDAEWLRESHRGRTWLKSIIERCNIIMFNAKFDLRVVSKELKIPFDWRHFEDVLYMYSSINENGLSGSNERGRGFGLKSLARTYLGVDYSGDEGLYIAERGTPEWTKLMEYLVLDLVCTRELYKLFKPRLGIEITWYKEHMRANVPLVASMEKCGVFVSEEHLDKLERKFEKEAKETLEKINAYLEQHGVFYPDFNPKSSKQLGEVLYTHLGLPVLGKTKGGAPSVAKGVLQDLLPEAGEHKEFLELVLEYSTIQHHLSNFVRAWKNKVYKGRVYPSWNLHGARTGRASCSDPNIMAFSKHSKRGKECRNIVVPPQGYIIISSDASQAEIRVQAVAAGDETWIQAFKEGRDIHTETARSINPKFDKLSKRMQKQWRTYAKRIGFGTLYGMTEVSLAKELGIAESSAYKMIETFYRKHPAIVRYKEEKRRELLETGRVFNRFTGKVMHVAKIPREGTPEYEALMRRVGNFEIQGAASSYVLMVARRLYEKWYKRGVRIFAFIHDDIVAYVPIKISYDYIQSVKQTFRDVGVEMFGDTVPFVCDIEWGERWGEMEEFKEE